ncbi:MAG: DUF1697 domain-containing protein [Gammaproteobacteria bacterium]
MSRFVILLRGVNVGKANRVPMAEFRSLLEGLGNTAVKTLLNSGNAVVSSAGRSEAKHAKAISEALQGQLNVDVPVVVKSAGTFAAAIAQSPAPPPEAEHSRFLVAFAQDTAALKDLNAIESLVQTPERFAIGDHAAYLHCASGIRESKAARALLGELGRGVTTRNWATALKLEALVNAS